MIHRTLTPSTEARHLEWRVLYSVRKHGGYFVHVRYTLARGTIPGLELITPAGVAIWTVPPSEWDRLPRASELPAAWESVGARPLLPDNELWLGPILRGLAERVEWWAKEKQTAINALLSVTAVRIHPTDTSTGICEQAGREIIDDMVELLTR
ncbi:MAG: hypothetical protein K8U57_24465 [Planctomycetes bacterium]|nr:hypothetical protein [Planctomycetota bacterium]